VEYAIAAGGYETNVMKRQWLQCDSIGERQRRICELRNEAVIRGAYEQLEEENT
jgi:hypothetical protein